MQTNSPYNTKADILRIMDSAWAMVTSIDDILASLAAQERAVTGHSYQSDRAASRLLALASVMKLLSELAQD